MFLVVVPLVILAAGGYVSHTHHEDDDIEAGNTASTYSNPAINGQTNGLEPDNIGQRSIEVIANAP